MKLVLSLLQIKSVRSAWIMLVGSGIILVYSSYQATNSFLYSLEHQKNNFSATFFLIWFLVFGGYIIISGWVLFSANGHSYLVEQEQNLKKRHRNFLWYFKFLIACFAASILATMLLVVVSLPFSDQEWLQWLFREHFVLIFLAGALVCSPLIFRHLK